MHDNMDQSNFCDKPPQKIYIFCKYQWQRLNIVTYVFSISDGFDRHKSQAGLTLVENIVVMILSDIVTHCDNVTLSCMGWVKIEKLPFPCVQIKFEDKKSLNYFQKC